ncbi:hypothetical protein OSI05_07060, partial [Mycobacterium ulcerans]
EAMDDALETSIERLRDHLRRPHARKRNHLTENAAYTVNQTDPQLRGSRHPGSDDTGRREFRGPD